MQFLEKTMENVTKYRNIQFVTTERRTNYLVSKPIYHIIKSFTENLFAIEMRKPQILMNKPVYIGLSMLDSSKSVTYGFWNDYLKLWRKCKTLLYGYRQIHFSCKYRRYLQRHLQRQRKMLKQGLTLQIFN